MHEMKFERVTLNVIRVGGGLENAGGTLWREISGNSSEKSPFYSTINGIPPPLQSSRMT